MSYRIGIDVGGTHTDAVVLGPDLRLVAKVKTATTPDVSTGIVRALHQVVRESGVEPSRFSHAMLGTTHSTNAIVERKRLGRVGVIRLGKPATLAVKPMTGWPEDLCRKLGGHRYVVQGGYEYDGREIAPVDEEEIREVCARMAGEVDAVAITSVFSPVCNEQELEVAQMVKEMLGEGIPVSLSHQIGSIGLLERENATILNAALIQTARAVADGFRQALEREGIRAAVYFGQNDGTLMTVDYAVRYPVLTVACGPTHSIRGAAFLSGCSEGLVVDVGGTTTDIGVLVKGFPRESAIAVEIGGVRTNFRMPDLLSIGLGGGTVVRESEGEIVIGPDSVGYEWVRRARLFGGEMLTVTDVAAAVGKVTGIGDRERLRGVDRALAERAYRKMVTMVEEAIDRMKTDASPVPVILVGGGSVLLPDRLEGVSEVIRPDHYEVANAIGAAIGQVSGQVERIYSLAEMSRDEALDHAKEQAVAEAVRAGADPSTVTIIDVEDIPLAYLPGNATRIRVKAAGRLRD